jgi:hypothetical protein
MTVNLRILQKDIIVVAVDSVITVSGTRKTRSKETRFTEYHTEPQSKFRVFDGVCVVTLWGELHPRNALLGELVKQNIKPETHTVDDVAYFAFEYLKNEYRPHEIFQNDIGSDFISHTGYHVCGFTPDAQPKCYNIFWGTDIPPRSPEQSPKYESYPKPYEEQHFRGKIEFVYTGRNDLAGNMIRVFLNEIERGLETRYDETTTIGKVQIADLALRFASEITRQVGPPFHIAVITPDNRIQTIENPSLSPVNLEEIRLD